MLRIRMKYLRENDNVFYLFPLFKKFGEKTSYVDATAIMQDALAADKILGYKPERGPNWGIESMRAHDYAEYVSIHGSIDNLSKFDTKNYTLVTNALTDEQVVRYSTIEQKDDFQDTHE